MIWPLLALLTLKLTLIESPCAKIRTQSVKNLTLFVLNKNKLPAIHHKISPLKFGDRPKRKKNDSFFIQYSLKFQN